MRLSTAIAVARFTGLAAAALIALAACSNPLGQQEQSEPKAPPKLSGSDVEKTIDEKIPPQFPKFDVGRAHCPDTMSLTADKPGTCTITVDGQQATVQVTRDSEASKSYHVATTQALINISQLETTLEHQTNGLQSAHCGNAAVQVIDPPGTIECTGMTAVKAVTLEVTIQDTDGKYSVEEKTDG
jgi:hypothetical protein